METLSSTSPASRGSFKTGIPQFINKRSHLDSAITKRMEKIKPKSVFSSTTSKQLEKLSKKPSEETKKKPLQTNMKKTKSTDQESKRNCVSRTDSKSINAAKNKPSDKNIGQDNWISLVNFVNDANVAKQVVNSMIQKNQTAILASKKKKSNVNVRPKASKEPKIDREILPLYEPEESPKVDNVQAPKRKHELDPNVTKTGMHLSNELFSSNNNLNELRNTYSSSSSTTTQSHDISKLKSKIVDEIKRIDMLDQFNVLKGRLSSLSCLKHKINEIRAQTLSNSITEEIIGNMSLQSEEASPEQVVEYIHSGDEKSRTENPKHLETFREKLMTKDKMIKEKKSKELKKTSFTRTNPPVYQSFVQLRGAQMPQWFPGYMEAFPNTNGVKITKTTNSTLLNAWKAVEPENFTDLNRYLIK